jgi:hypothetical protein
VNYLLVVTYFVPDFCSFRHTHKSAAAQLERNARLRDAFGLERPEEDKFKSDIHNPKKPKTYAMVRTPSPEPVQIAEMPKAKESKKRKEQPDSADDSDGKREKRSKKKSSKRKKRDR